MKIKTFFKTLFCIGLVVALCLYLLHIYGNYIEQTQQPITDYTYNGYQEKSSYKNSNVIFTTYNSKQCTLHTGDRILDKIKSGNIPNPYYFKKRTIYFLKEISCLWVMPRLLYCSQSSFRCRSG